MIMRYGSPPRRGMRYIRRPGVYAILPRGGNILATFQEAPLPEVQLPGGGIDPGEDPIRALHREVLEETGWTIAAPRLFTRFRRFTYMPEYDLWAEKLCTIYVAHPARRLGPPREAGHSALWLARDGAAEMLATDGDRAAMADWLRHRSGR